MVLKEWRRRGRGGGIEKTSWKMLLRAARPKGRRSSQRCTTTPSRQMKRRAVVRWASDAKSTYTTHRASAPREADAVMTMRLYMRGKQPHTKPTPTHKVACGQQNSIPKTTSPSPSRSHSPSPCLSLYYRKEHPKKTVCHAQDKRQRVVETYQAVPSTFGKHFIPCIRPCLNLYPPVLLALGSFTCFAVAHSPYHRSFSCRCA